ncbi:hypothetical protein [Dactylosporangium sp. NPDC051541]|uniref:hypothetical protein n=1 Tax=Dactylosporangium sp. NPDC051541 TaxID=3363977 RepID=UPI003793F79D
MAPSPAPQTIVAALDACEEFLALTPAPAQRPGPAHRPAVQQGGHRPPTAAESVTGASLSDGDPLGWSLRWRPPRRLLQSPSVR